MCVKENSFPECPRTDRNDFVLTKDFIYGSIESLRRETERSKLIKQLYGGYSPSHLTLPTITAV